MTTTIKLYHHKTDDGAEYLMDNFIEFTSGIDGKKHKEGIFEGSKYIVRIDGDITKDAELQINEEKLLPFPKCLHNNIVKGFVDGGALGETCKDCGKTWRSTWQGD